MKIEDSTQSRLFLQVEAAALLRRSQQAVKRLRLTGRLGYYKRRPVVISSEQLNEFVASAKVLTIRKPGRPPANVSANVAARPFKLLTLAEAADAFGCSVSELQECCDKGRLPYITGKPLFVDEADLRDLQHGRQFGAKDEPEPDSMEARAKERGELAAAMRKRIRMIRLRKRLSRIFSGAKRD